MVMKLSRRMLKDPEYLGQELEKMDARLEVIEEHLDIQPDEVEVPVEPENEGAGDDGGTEGVPDPADNPNGDDPDDVSLELRVIKEFKHPADGETSYEDDRVIAAGQQEYDDLLATGCFEKV